MSRSTWVDVLVMTVVFSIVLTRSAHAYLDPGTGSMIIQVLIAVFLGAAASARIFWKQIRGFFQRTFHRSKPSA